MTQNNISLDDKFTITKGRIFISGNQALVRLPIIQKQLDAKKGLNTAGFISGYRGSPLGNYDAALWKAKDQLAAHEIIFQPGVNEDLAGDTFLVQNLASDVAASSPAFTQIAVEKVIPGVGQPFIALALFFFAFTTLLAYYYIAETNLAYLKRTINIPGLDFFLKIALLSATFYGTIKTANLAWGLGDVGVGIMAWLNIVGILLIFFMSKPALKALKDYEAQRKAGVKRYTFDPRKLGIENADFWVERCKKEERKQK